MLVLLSSIHCLTYSILLNSSKSYYNYRHMTNLYLLSYITKSSTILPFFTIDTCKYYNKIYLTNTKTLNFTNTESLLPKTENQTNLQILKILNLETSDIKGSTKTNPSNSINTETSKKSEKLKYTPLEPIGYTSTDFIDIFYNPIFDTNDNILIYMCGHGTDGMFKFYDKEWLTKEDLMRAVKYLCANVNKVLLIIDTCQAETMVDRNMFKNESKNIKDILKNTNDVKDNKDNFENLNTTKDNLYIVTTSLRNENSYSNHSCDLIGVATVDNFMYELYNKLGSYREEKLNNLFGRIGDIGSTMSCSDKEEFVVGDFNLYKSV